MDWKGFIADYLTFSRKDRIGILVLLGLILGVLFLPKLTRPGKNSKPVDTAWIASMKKIEQKDPEKESRSPFAGQKYDGETDDYAYRPSESKGDQSWKGQLFFFDPNTLGLQEWKKLGLTERTIHTIQNYLQRGGQFRKPADMQRIYGLKPAEYKRLEPYIKIESATEIKKPDKFLENNNKRSGLLIKDPITRYAAIDINTADTSALIALPGIGSKLAARIVNFRDKLGGFYTLLQVGETFGLPDSTFQKIKPYLKLENAFIKKININTATLDELKAHPYIRWQIANPIVAYRNEHGPFLTLEDIKKVMAVTDDIYNKITPYLTTQ
jgi:competence protein ComEA